MSVLLVMLASSVVETALEVIEALMEAVYKHNHTKRRCYW